MEDIVLEPDVSLQELLNASAAKATQLHVAIRRSVSKHRYLRYLSDQYNKDSEDDESNCCVLCKCEFSKVSQRLPQVEA